MSICPRCAVQFTCAIAEQTNETCWCTTLPVEPILPIYPELTNAENPSCFCPICLQEWNSAAVQAKQKL